MARQVRVARLPDAAFVRPIARIPDEARRARALQGPAERALRQGPEIE